MVVQQNGEDIKRERKARSRPERLQRAFIMHMSQMVGVL